MGYWNNDNSMVDISPLETYTIIEKASEILGLSKRQFSRFLSGETYAKRVHSLAMQMVWLISENKREFDNKLVKKKAKKISIPIK